MGPFPSPDPRLRDLGILALRLGFGVTLALAHGFGKVTHLSGFVAKVAELGIVLPSVLGPAAALSEFVGGLMVAAGLYTRIAASFVAATMLVAALVVHAADPFQRKELAFAYALIALVLVVIGPGRYSVDDRLQDRI